jgi:SAM-dependent methyltransferase
METSKSHGRRVREGWFDRYVKQPVIDIGCGGDPLVSPGGLCTWDSSFGNSDATLMDGVGDESFATVYSSHCLEHIQDPLKALGNWWRILKPGGHLIVVVPHRDLYECRMELPSQFNPDHKWFFVPHSGADGNLHSHTLGLFGTIRLAIPNGKIVSFRVLDDGWKREGFGQAVGEYSIECIVKKT